MKARIQGWLIIGVLAGCAAVDDDSALVPCPRDAVCWGPDGTGLRFEGRPQWDGTCVAADMVLEPGGAITRADAPGIPFAGARWSQASDEFDLCFAHEGCFACEWEADDAGTAESSGGRCTGYPRSCGSVSPGSCSSIRGCRFHNRVRWDGSLDPECTGSADRCDGIHDADSCYQQGCEWAS